VGWLRDTLGRWSGSGDGGADRRGATVAKIAPDAPEAPDAPDWRALGNAALSAGKLHEAAQCYEQGVLAAAGDPTLRVNLGFVNLELGQFQAAIDRLQQALALRRPDDTFAHEAFYLLGRAQAGLEKLDEAFRSFAEAARLQPGFIEPVEEAARVLHRLKRHGEAAAWARRLYALRPEPFTRMLVGNELLEAGALAEAADWLASICADEPGNPEASVLFYGALLKLQRNEEALAEVDRAIGVLGRSASLLVNRSVPLDRLGRIDEAVADLEEALALEPARRDALLNRVSMLLQQARVPESVGAAEQALTLFPDDADLHWGLCMGLLTLGDYARGWRESEWRMRSPAFQGKILQLEQPQWRGEDLRGRTIFLHGEQGFGDNIQFVRFVPEVARRAANVLLLVPAALEPLVASSLPANCRLVPQNSLLPAIDFQSPLMSLPAVLGTTLETLPADVPYLQADPLLVAKWRKRLPADKVNVGIAWAGNPRHVNDRNRSTSLAALSAVFAADCRFVTVQPQLSDADRATLAKHPQVLDLGRELGDFSDTAALFAALDLVITVDTSVAHLAGALNRPVWVLLPHAPDWRWLLERSDSPWYPSARLYRQPAPRDWASVMDSVRRDLVDLCAAR
jgi:tetratricopeptide (TPR) repeat protein